MAPLDKSFDNLFNTLIQGKEKDLVTLENAAMLIITISIIKKIIAENPDAIEKLYREAVQFVNSKNNNISISYSTFMKSILN